MDDEQQALSPEPPKDEVLRAYQEDMKRLIRERVTRSGDTERTAQYRVARRNHLYFEGKQNLAPNWIVPGELADWVPIGGSPPVDEESESSQRRFDAVFNFIRSDTFKAVAVTGQAPTVHAVADDPNSPDSVQAAKDAQAIGDAFMRRCEADEVQKEIMHCFRIHGPAFAYVRWVSDAEKNGYTSIPLYKTEDIALDGTAGYECLNCGQFTPMDAPSPIPMACPQCSQAIPSERWKPADTIPMPVATGEVAQYANGFPEVSIENTMTVMVPSDIKKLDDSPYLHYERELNPARVLAIHPELASKLEDMDAKKGSGSGLDGSTLGADTRALAHSTDASTAWARDNWSYALTWLRPAMYWYCKNQRKREALQKMFPEGLRLTFCCDELIDMSPENFLHVWKAAPPGIGNRLLQDPLCNDDIPLNDFYNDTQNLLHQTAQRGIPATIADSKVFDADAFRKRPPSPAEMIFAPLAGQDPNKLMAKLPTATFPSDIIPWITQVREDNRDINGITRAIAGAEGKTNTAEEARLKQNAALRQLSVSYDRTRSLWCGIAELAVKQTAKYGIGRIQAPSRQGVFGRQSRVVDTSRLSPDGFHFEADPGMPANFAEERDRVLGYLKESPLVADMIGLTHPINAGQAAAYLRIPGIVVPGENLRDKVRWQIEQLLKGSAIQGPDGSMQPSIMPDPWDPHDIVASLIYTWCDSEEGIDKREMGDPGFENVLAFANAHKALAMPMMPGAPQGGGPAPAAQGGGPPQPGAPAGPPPGPMPPDISTDSGVPMTDFAPPEITAAPNPSTIQ